MLNLSCFDVYLSSSLVNLFLCREDLVRGLLDMEQPGSDQENLDSEASLSSESLLDEQQRSSAHNSEPEGQYQVESEHFLLCACLTPVGF